MNCLLLIIYLFLRLLTDCMIHIFLCKLGSHISKLIIFTEVKRKFVLLKRKYNNFNFLKISLNIKDKFEMLYYYGLIDIYLNKY